MKLCGDDIMDIVHPLLRDKPYEQIKEQAKQALHSSVSYYYKSATKYPARVYVLLGKWQRRNLRPMGLMNEFERYWRGVTEGEAATILQSLRMTYYQYESWAELVQAEIRTCCETGKILEMLETMRGLKLRDGKCDPGKIEQYANAEKISSQQALELT